MNIDWWRNRLGFEPEEELEIERIERQCYKCGSENVERLDSSSWTGKVKCNDCGYFTYALYTDRMGGRSTDYIAIDSRDSKSI